MLLPCCYNKEIMLLEYQNVYNALLQLLTIINNCVAILLKRVTNHVATPRKTCYKVCAYSSKTVLRGPSVTHMACVAAIQL